MENKDIIKMLDNIIKSIDEIRSTKKEQKNNL